jgi:hypothetical protein
MSKIHVAGWLVLGAALGVGLGLFVGWVVWPVTFSDATPDLLSDPYRRDYALMTATAYQAEGDLAAARARLGRLDADGPQWLLSTTLDLILADGDEADIRRLARLAADLGLSAPALEPYLDSDGD